MYIRTVDELTAQPSKVKVGWATGWYKLKCNNCHAKIMWMWDSFKRICPVCGVGIMEDKNDI